MIRFHIQLLKIANYTTSPSGAEKASSYSEEALARLKSDITRSFYEFRGSVESGKKDFLRELHKTSKKRADSKALNTAQKEFKKLSSYFVCPEKLIVDKIKPVLLNVDSCEKYKRLFKLVRHTWSMPYSKGYGRRLRFIVWDEYHESVIGIIGLQSPPADLACRDALFDYPKGQKLDFVNRTLDVYTLGSIPPYSNLLGGKLVAGLVASKPILESYWSKYAGKQSVMNKQLIEQPLVAATTTSAFGRSSIYNRLKFNDRLLAKPIGYTKGYGSIHLEPHLEEIVNLLKSFDLYHNGGYGKGPKAKWQNIVRALQHLGLSQKYLQHGLGREVFLFDFVSNLEDGMSGGNFGVSINMSVDKYSHYWLERWAIARSERMKNWREVNVTEYFLHALSN